MTEEEGEEPMVKTDTSHVQQLTTNTHSCIDEEGEGEVRSKSLLSILEYRFNGTRAAPYFESILRYLPCEWRPYPISVLEC